jgi:hypothetical protein
MKNQIEEYNYIKTRSVMKLDLIIISFNLYHHHHKSEKKQIKKQHTQLLNKILILLFAK